jgi:Sec-independent protein translocase protein TatA
MPEIARKIGKIMAEFRGTANEFKQTWQNEVDFEEEAKALDLNSLESEVVERKPARLPTRTAEAASEADVSAPMIKEMDPADFEARKANASSSKKELGENKKAIAANDPDSDSENRNDVSNGKETWL